MNEHHQKFKMESFGKQSMVFSHLLFLLKAPSQIFDQILNTECASLTISSQLYFLRVSAVWSLSYHGSVGEFRIKNPTLGVFYKFICIFFCFSSLKCVCFCHFHFFFCCQSIKFPQLNINESETGICDNKLSVELYVLYWQRVLEFPTT